MFNFLKFTFKSSLIGFSSLAYGCLLTTLVFNPSVQAQTLKGEQPFFQHSPYLIHDSESNLIPSTRGIVTFTIDVPADAGESLKAITITHKNMVEQLDFAEADTRAVLGSDYSRGTPLTLSSIGGPQDPNDKSTILVFDQPVEPGNTVTVRLRVRDNPLYGGVYLLGVTAFPDNPNSMGLPLGNVRLDFPGFNN